MAKRFEHFLAGPHLRLPRPVDALSEWWAGRRPRVRLAVTLLGCLLVAFAVDSQSRAVDARWGGEPRKVLVATADLRVGDPVGNVRVVELPPVAVPPSALSEVGGDAVLAMALPRGAVLTRTHVDPRGAAVGLDDGMRAVPIPTEPGWGVVEGGWVDVWTLGAGDQPSRLVARSRPVVQIRDATAGLTSLVGLADDEVEAVTSGLALGRVLLTHAPPPA